MSNRDPNKSTSDSEQPEGEPIKEGERRQPPFMLHIADEALARMVLSKLTNGGVLESGKSYAITMRPSVNAANEMSGLYVEVMPVADENEPPS